MDMVRISDSNKNNLLKLTQILNISGTALTNYILDMTLKEVEIYFNGMNHKLKESFKESLSDGKFKVGKIRASGNDFTNASKNRVSQKKNAHTRRDFKKKNKVENASQSN